MPEDGGVRARRQTAGPAVRRPRARDIAELVGVSETAVSFALNGRPGISEETRARILSAVAELGFTPNYAARALTGAGSSTIGFVVARAPESIGTESFFLHLVAGIQSTLSARHYGLLFQVVPSVAEELDVYRRWSSERRVDGVVLVDLHQDDARPAALRDLGLAAVLVGGPDPEARLSSVSIDDVAATRLIIDHLAGLGHRRIAYVAGDPALEHVRQRAGAFMGYAGEAGADVVVVPTDFSAQAGSAAVAEQLARTEPPTAIVFENEVLAVAGVGVLKGRDLAVPGDVAVVSFEDGVICAATRPQITALHRQTYRYGAAVAEHLMRQVDGGRPASVVLPPPALVVRGSSDPAVTEDVDPSVF
ncbi:LacI family transcriptional regulator [Georgenia sp. TF02-10]|uniref:LacI family DNA-binding transcriptional regulator n=1 Tax=Georgenia sp. TF02-10 TaxID=2917725 RepID=UPI001FA78414|nr:LacI family DNA-binding transcriptional regulator [Georgenia sp. TF02-10]UNX54918.1 LacI family transcriptional regulator [Georgenia sp. TF02-10]